MKRLSLFCITLILSGITFSQKEIKYFTPPAVSNDDLVLKLDDIISDKETCKLKLIVENKSKDAYLVYNTNKTGFNYDGLGVYYPEKSKEMVIAPGDKKSRVVKITGNDYRIPNFMVQAEGLTGGAIPDEAMGLSNLPVETGKAQDFDLAGLKVEMQAPEVKKGEVSSSLEITFDGSANQLVILDASKLKVETTAGNALATDFSKDKLIELRPGDKVKVKFSFQANANPTVIAWNEAVKLINLEHVDINPINVSSTNSAVAASSAGKVDKKKTKQPKSDKVITHSDNGNTSSIVAGSNSTATTSNCTPFKGPKNEKVKFSIQNDGGHCFKLDVDGFPVITDYASVAIIYVDYGKRKMKFTFQDGSVVEEKTWVTDNYDALGVKIKRNKKGEYNVKNDLGAQVLSAKGKQETSNMTAKTKAATEISGGESSSSAGSSASGDGSPSGGGGCYGDHTSGTTTVKLKITWKGAPVANNSIQIKIGGGVVGVGATDGSGIAKIKTSDLPIKKIDVYGCKGSKTWSVTGDWCVLDGSNYFHLKLDEVAAFMAEMMGMTVDEVGSSWGM